MSLSLILTLSVVAYLAASVLWSIIFKKRAFVRVICIATVAVLSFVGTLMLKNIITTPDKLMSTLSSIPGIESLVEKIGQMIGTSETLAEVVGGLSAALISPAIFMTLFFSLLTFSFVLRFILGLILMILHIKASPNLPARALLGFAYGFIVVFCVLVPVSAYVGTASSALPELKELDVIPEETAAQIEEPLSELNGSAVIKTHRILGGNLVIKPMSSIRVHIGNDLIKTDLNTELGSICAFASDAMALFSVPMDQYTENETKALEELAASLPDSKLLAVTATEVIHLATDAWVKGEPFMGVAQPTLGADLDPLLDRTVRILNADSTNVDYLCEDINTFAKVLSKLLAANSNTAAPEGGEGGADIGKALMTSGVIRDMLTEINKNPRMRPLIPVVTNIGLKMVATQLGIPASSEDAYGSFVDDVTAELVNSSALPDDVRIDKMESVLGKSLSKLGVGAVDDSDITVISLALVSFFPGENASSATPEAVSSFLDELTASIDTSTGGVAPVVSNGSFSTVKLDSVPESDAVAAGKLISAICAVQNDDSLTPEQKSQKILQLFAESQLVVGSSIPETKLSAVAGEIADRSQNRVGNKAKASLSAVKGLKPSGEDTSFTATSKVILIDETVDDITEEEMQKFINSVADVFEETSTITGGGEMDVGALCGSLGNVLDTLAENDKLYGKEKTDTLTELILKSDTVIGTTGINPKDIDAILEKKNEKDVSYSALMGTVSGTTEILNSIQNGQEITDEQVTALIESLTREGAGEVISSLISEEKLKEMGLSDGEHDGAIASAAALLRNVFTDVSMITDEAKHAAEAAALKRLVCIALDANKNAAPGSSAFGGEDSRLGCTAGELIDDIIASEAICRTLANSDITPNPFGMNLSDNDEAQVADAINARLASANAEDALALRQLAKLLGVEL